MNYRHAFHAGNHADVVKHVVLIACLAALTRKAAPFAVLDAHAGRGLYDLAGAEASRSPEWRDGIGRLAAWDDAPEAVSAYLEAVARAGERTGVGAPLAFYPGSPLLIAQALRGQDRLITCELHQDEFAALKRQRFGDARVERHRRDAWEALGALLPFRENRGLVLIDPPYEAEGELLRAAGAIKAALARFGHGVFLWWRPLKDLSALDIADAELGREALRADLWVDTPRREGKLAGSSLPVVNAPFGMEDVLREALPALAARMSVGDAGWNLVTSGL